MQSSNAPNKISLPFAASGTKNAIPVPSQQGVTPGAASFTDGFPPLTFTPLSAGGVPPAGADFNGILNAITALQQWKSAGGQFPFDATFAAAIGGYPKGATVLKADGTGLWISTTENNTTNPDTGGAGWLAFAASSIQSGSYNTAPDTGTANAYAIAISPAPVALVPGMKVTLLHVKNLNTGPSTLNVNGMGALPIVGAAGASLQGGEIGAAADVTFIMNWSLTAWGISSSTNSAVQVGVATRTNQAVNLGQFSSVFGVTGNQYLPSGRIIQHGTTPVIASGVSADITFPVAYPNACEYVLLTPISGVNGVGSLSLGCFGVPSKTAFSVSNYYTNSLSGYWVSSGY